MASQCVPTQWVYPPRQAGPSAGLTTLHSTVAVSPSPLSSCTRSMLLRGCFRNKAHANPLPFRWRALRKEAGRFILSDCPLWCPSSTDSLNRVTVQGRLRRSFTANRPVLGDPDKAGKMFQSLLNPSDSSQSLDLGSHSTVRPTRDQAQLSRVSRQLLVLCRPFQNRSNLEIFHCPSVTDDPQYRTRYFPTASRGRI